jgi:hypothetical protein
MTMRPDLRLKLAGILAAYLLASVSLAGYLLIGSRGPGYGFPLDDAWIHQTYARNLAGGAGWVFQPGELSAGSTSPLWTLLLAPGHMLGVAPVAWNFILGSLVLGSVIWVSVVWLLRRGRVTWRTAMILALLLGLEWHLVWAAASGMETLLQALLVLAFFWALERGGSAVFLGALIGLGVWIRPDALTLLLPAAIRLAATGGGRKAFSRGAAGLAAGLAVLFLPYLLFNHSLGGEWWPSTFFAKQAEYAELRQVSYLRRLAQQAALPFIGVGVVLLPGLFGGWAAGRSQAIVQRLNPLIWTLGWLALYAWRLPVTYQHGRYAMPVIPVLVVLGWEGLWALVESAASPRTRRLLGFGCGALVVGVAAGFWASGARALSEDLAYINSQMVDTAVWVASHTPPDTVIAAHDIGALGYFGQRRILDLAGLISAEVIPFIRDEVRLAEFLDRNRAEYLVAFPGWYPGLAARGEQVYQAGHDHLQADWLGPMTVFRWK